MLLSKKQLFCQKRWKTFLNFKVFLCCLNFTIIRHNDVLSLSLTWLDIVYNSVVTDNSQGVHWNLELTPLTSQLKAL